jgi:hypothetical protein
VLFDAKLKDALQNIKGSYGLTFTNMGWLGVTSVGQVIRVRLIKWPRGSGRLNFDGYHFV